MSKAASQKVKKTFKMSALYEANKNSIKGNDRALLDFTENEIKNGNEHGEHLQIKTTAFRKARVGFTDWVIVFEEKKNPYILWGY